MSTHASNSGFGQFLKCIMDLILEVQGSRSIEGRQNSVQFLQGEFVNRLESNLTLSVDDEVNGLFRVNTKDLSNPDGNRDLSFAADFDIYATSCITTLVDFTRLTCFTNPGM